MSKRIVFESLNTLIILTSLHFLFSYKMEFFTEFSLSTTAQQLSREALYHIKN